MQSLKHIEDCGGGGYLGRFVDGSEYAFHPGSGDTAGMHVALCQALEAKAVPVVPHVADPVLVKAYLASVIDQTATLRLQTASGAASAAQTAKLDEARDVLDMLLTDANAVAALTDEDRILRYPTLAASGPDLAATARLVMSKAAEQRQNLYKLEKWRLDAKSAIRAAPTAEQARVAFDRAIATPG